MSHKTAVVSYPLLFTDCPLLFIYVTLSDQLLLGMENNRNTLLIEN